MTGGIGFSRDISNTQKKNRDLLGSRKSNAENPYWGNKKQPQKRAVNFFELLSFKKKRTSSLKRRSALILIIIGTLALVIWGILYVQQVY